MRVMPIMLCLLLAAGCDEERSGPNADMRSELSRTNEQLGGLTVLFAATVVEGGGVKGNNKNPPQVVLDVSKEFPGQHVATGRLKLGKQNATFRIIASSQFEADRDFEVPLNGTRIIAFGWTGAPGKLEGGPLTVYANDVFADTEANHANATLGRAPRKDPWFQLPFFFASVAFAFAAIFAVWFRVKYGMIALAVSIAFWLGYEVTVPSFSIRIDLLILFPFMLAAFISAMIAAVHEEPTPGQDQPKHRLRGL